MCQRHADQAAELYAPSPSNLDISCYANISPPRYSLAYRDPYTPQFYDVTQSDPFGEDFQQAFMKIRANSVVTPYKSSPHPLVRGRAIIQSAHKQLFFTLRSNDRLGPTLYTTAIDDTSQYEVFFMGSGQAEISFKYMICFQNHSETSLLHPENWRCFVYEEIFKQS